MYLQIKFIFCLKGGMYVSKIMELSPTLEHLDVGDCNLTMGGLMYILGQLQNNIGAPSLKVIDLSRPIPDSEYYQYPPSHMAESVGLIMSVILIKYNAKKN